MNNDNCDEYLKCLSENILAGNFRQLDAMIDDNEADVNLIIKEFESAIHDSCVAFKKTRRKYTNRKQNCWFDNECKQAKHVTMKL